MNSADSWFSLKISFFIIYSRPILYIYFFFLSCFCFWYDARHLVHLFCASCSGCGFDSFWLVQFWIRNTKSQIVNKGAMNANFLISILLFCCCCFFFVVSFFLILFAFHSSNNAYNFGTHYEYLSVWYNLCGFLAPFKKFPNLTEKKHAHILIWEKCQRHGFTAWNLVFISKFHPWWNKWKMNVRHSAKINSSRNKQ